MAFTLTINTGPATEVARILRQVADGLADTPWYDVTGARIDASGATVGSWQLTPDDNDQTPTMTYRTGSLRADGTAECWTCGSRVQAYKVPQGH